MCIEAANAIAQYAEERGISEGYIIPSMEEREMYVYEAVAVARKAMEQGVAGRKMGVDELEKEVRKKIERVGR
jgi:malate dehydrogenase (oxaloacetate-decarboxylating)